MLKISTVSTYRTVYIQMPFWKMRNKSKRKEREKNRLNKKRKYKLFDKFYARNFWFAGSIIHYFILFFSLSEQCFTCHSIPFFYDFYICLGWPIELKLILEMDIFFLFCSCENIWSQLNDKIHVFLPIEKFYIENYLS